jgi:glycosyltransferase involved in cell wall biosynthesis
MKTKIAFDVSGLAWKYRSGVQNLYWAYIDAFAKNPAYLNQCNVIFYDRSGIFNQSISSVIPRSYQSCAPIGWPNQLRRPMQFLVKTGIVPSPKLEGFINQVWNWDIFNPIGASGSITIPDILPMEYPQWFSSRFQNQTERAIRFATQDAQFINCISYDVRERLSKYAGIDENRIKVIYPGIDQTYFAPISSELQDQTLSKYGLVKNGYLLSFGFLDPRKNLKRQLEAFGMYAQKNKSPLKYVLTGLKTNLSQDVLDLIETPSLRDKVIFLGYISAEDLRILTSTSAFVMYCSIAEGFGLPIIESMALGVQVVTSNTSSMQELASGRAVLANPESVELIAQAIAETQGISEHDKQKRIISNYEFSKNFTIDQWLEAHINHMMDGAISAKH